MTRPGSDHILPTMDPAAAAALSTSAFLSILLLAVLSGYAIRRTGFQWATEGSVALLLGLGTGGAMFLYYFLADPNHRVPRRLVEFDEDMFFQTLLPPIIFAAGFSVKKKLFFRNFVTLIMFGVLGTMFSAAVLAAGSLQLMAAVGLPLRGLLRTSLALGSVLSCTDSVASLSVLDGERHPLLYSLLFGEGVVNDATAIVLLGAIAGLPFNPADESKALGLAGLGALALQFLRLFVLSTALGLGVGVASAALVRWLFRRPNIGHAAGGGEHSVPNQEVLVVALLGLVAYFLAEGLNLSAILSVFFCGIAMSHYTWHSLSPAAKVITRHGFHVISSACEVVLFVYAGLDVWVTAVWWRPDISKRYLLAAVALAGGLLLMLLAARAAVCFPLCWVANRLWRRRDPIPEGGAAVLWWGGLPRGAITLALAYHCFYDDAGTKPEQLVVISAVILVVLVTTVGFGVVTQPVIKFLMPSPSSPAAAAAPAPLTHGSALPVHVHTGGGGDGGGGELGLRVPLLQKAAGGNGGGGAVAVYDSASAPPLGAAFIDDSGLADGGGSGAWSNANDMLWRGEVPGMTIGVPSAPSYNAEWASGGVIGGGGGGSFGSGSFLRNSSGPSRVGTSLVQGAPVEGHPRVLQLAQGPPVLGSMGSGGGGGGGGGGYGGAGGGAAEVDEESTWLHKQWRRFDARWLQPLLGGSRTDGAC